MVWCDRDGASEKIHTQMDYLTTVQPHPVTAQGLFNALENALKGLGTDRISAEQYKKLVGIGTDGASANIAAAGLKGLIEEHLSWVYWIWYLAHRL